MTAPATPSRMRELRLEPPAIPQFSRPIPSRSPLVRRLTNGGPAAFYITVIATAQGQAKPRGQEMEMKMNLFRTATAAFVIAAGLAAANSASAYERWVDIHNVADTTVVAIQISDINNNHWGPDILSGVIPANGVGEVDPVNTRGYCRFDIRLTYADGSAADIHDVNLCEATDVVTDGYTYDVYSI